MNAPLRIVLALSMLTLMAAADGAGKVPAQEAPSQNGQSLSQLARASDLVAVGQVMETEYKYTRSFPSEGSAYLKLLITYKRNRPGDDTIEVREKGLHPHECYFKPPGTAGAGGRFLVFLRLDPDDPDSYRGLPVGCALQVLVRDDRLYALRYPPDGIALTDRLGDLATAFQFEDRHALIDADEITPKRRDALLQEGLIVPYGDGFKYTHGVDLTTVRKLIGAEALSSRGRE